MKKLITTVAVVALGVSAQAALISWGNNPTALLLDTNGDVMTDPMAQAASLSMQLINITQGGIVVHERNVMSMTAGEFVGNWNFTHGVEANTNDQFAILMTATFGGVDYGMSIWSSASATTPWTYTGTDDTFVGAFAWAAGNVGAPVNPGSANWDQLSADNQGAWTPVPEPATGMLALAGAAMLLRRRRRA